MHKGVCIFLNIQWLAHNPSLKFNQEELNLPHWKWTEHLICRTMQITKYTYLNGSTRNFTQKIHFRWIWKITQLYACASFSMLICILNASRRYSSKHVRMSFDIVIQCGSIACLIVFWFDLIWFETWFGFRCHWKMFKKEKKVTKYSVSTSILTQLIVTVVT